MNGKTDEKKGAGLLEKAALALCVAGTAVMGLRLARLLAVGAALGLKALKKTTK